MTVNIPGAAYRVFIEGDPGFPGKVRVVDADSGNQHYPDEVIIKMAAGALTTAQLRFGQSYDIAEVVPVPSRAQAKHPAAGRLVTEWTLKHAEDSKAQKHLLTCTAKVYDVNDQGQLQHNSTTIDSHMTVSDAALILASDPEEILRYHARDACNVVADEFIKKLMGNVTMKPVVPSAWKLLDSDIGKRVVVQTFKSVASPANYEGGILARLYLSLPGEQSAEVRLDSGNLWSGTEEYVTLGLGMNDYGKWVNVRKPDGSIFRAKIVSIWAINNRGTHDYKVRVECPDGTMFTVDEQDVTIVEAPLKGQSPVVCEECGGTGVVHMFNTVEPCSQGCKAP